MTSTFQLEPLIPDLNWRDDEIGALDKFINEVLQPVLNLAIEDLDRFKLQNDPDQADENVVNAMLQDLGNPFEVALSQPLDRRRLLVRLLVRVYLSKGTAPGLIDVLRALTGIQAVSVISPATVEGWLLNESVLGDGDMPPNPTFSDDAVLGPSVGFIRYSFEVEVLEALTDDQREIATEIINLVKPAHTHFVGFREPGVGEDIEPWEISISELDDSTDLHGATPLDVLDNVGLWLDSRDGDTITPSIVSGYAQAWEDKAKGIVFSESLYHYQPKVDGSPGLIFDGINDKLIAPLTTTKILSGNDATVFIAASSDDDTINQTALWMGGAGFDTSFFAASWMGNLVGDPLRVGTRGFNPTKPFRSAATRKGYTAGKAHILSGIVSGSSYRAAWIDDEFMGFSTLGDGLMGGAFHNSAAIGVTNGSTMYDYFKGRIYELVVVDGILDPASFEWGWLMRYLFSRWRAGPFA